MSQSDPTIFEHLVMNGSEEPFTRLLRNGHKDSGGVQFPEPPAPRKRTTARPGSAEKIQELCERLERNEGLWHPNDK